MLKAMAIAVATLQSCVPTECAPEPAAAPVEWTVNWDSVAQCESGGNWSHRPVTNSSGTYSGGLMIGHQWWPKFGGREFASYPYQASKAQQIIVAERIVDAQGGGYAGADRGWQCVR
jgi:resuscitation-promoting factor RpfA